MKNKTVICKCTIEIPELETETLDIGVEFVGSASYGNMGIGQYEFWGYKGNQVEMGWDFDGYEWDKTLYTPEENKIIGEWADKNDKTIVNALANDLEDFEREIDDRDPSDIQEDNRD